jgi:AcrR family transcriptional regulator
LNPDWKTVEQVTMARKADPKKRIDILAAATKVFAQKGYAAARIIEVAKAAGVGKGTIYEYFRSKEELFFAVFESMMRSMAESMSQTADRLDGPFADRMRALSDQIILSWLDQLDTYALVMEFWSATASSPSRNMFKKLFQQGYRQLRTVVQNLIETAQAANEVSADIDPYKIASAMIGTWDALLLQAWIDSEFDALAVSRSYMDVILRGLMSAVQPSPPLAPLEGEKI